MSLMSVVTTTPSRLTGIGAQIGIVPRLLIGLLLSVITSVAVVDGWTTRATFQAARTQELSELDVGLQLLKATLLRHGKNFRAQGDDLTLDGASLSGRNDVVDFVHDTTGAAATIFAGTTRIATTVRKPDGSRAVGTQLAPGPAQQALAAGRTYRGQNAILGRLYATVYEPVRDPDGRQVGALYVGVPIDALEASSAGLFRDALLVGLAVAVAIGLLGWLGLRQTVRPLSALAVEMRAIAGGDLERPVPLTARTDQIGQMARALDQLRGTARQAQLADAAAETQRRRLESEKQAALVGMASTIRAETAHAVHSAQGGSAALSSVAEAISSAALRSNGQAERAAQATTAALARAQTAAVSADQLSASIRAITEQVAHSSVVVSGAVQTGDTAQRMFAELTEQIVKVGTVADMIADIAGRTNLLALNAAIEAARAGEAGRGFAVVASEVKALATQTARSTEEIGGRLTEVRAAAAEAAAAMARIQADVSSIDGIAAAIARSVDEQGAATASIARDMADTAHAMHEAAGCIGQVTDDVQRTGGRAAEVHRHADSLVSSVTSLQDALDRVLVTPAQDAQNRRAA